MLTKQISPQQKTPQQNGDTAWLWRLAGGG